MYRKRKIIASNVHVRVQFLLQNENIHLNPEVDSQYVMDVDRLCLEVPAGGGKVQM